MSIVWSELPIVWCDVTTCRLESTMTDEGTENKSNFCQYHGQLAESTAYTCFGGQTRHGKWILLNSDIDTNKRPRDDEKDEAVGNKRLAPICDQCGTKDLPGGSTACSVGDGCIACEDCVCPNCHQCKKIHCSCKGSDDEEDGSSSEDEEDE